MKDIEGMTRADSEFPVRGVRYQETSDKGQAVGNLTALAMSGLQSC
jgi:hypothetical protein